MRDVQASPDLERIAKIPRRVWTPAQTAEAVEILTQTHRTPRGTMRLLDHQAIALAEISVYGGAFLPLPVGSGKTLISFLAMRSRPESDTLRPLLLTRAGLLGKTRSDEIDLRRDWILPGRYIAKSYEEIARVGAADFFERYPPTLIVVDEAHALKNRQASVTRRVFRYLRANPAVPLIVLTGSPIGTSLRDVSHLLERSLGSRCPVPTHHLDLEEWCAALDVDVHPSRRLDPGAIMRLAAPLEDARAAVCRRIVETPGVVTMAGQSVDVPIVVRSHVAPFCAAQTAAMDALRATGETPDGELAEDSIAIWRHARELSLGFYSVWDPRPPRPWIEARRTWHRACRDVIENNRRDLDSAEQVDRHVRAHPTDYPNALDALRAWRAVEPSFTPNPKAFWISGETVDWIGRWISRDTRPAIVWTDRPAFGAALSALLGIPYYGEEGLDASGRSIRTATGTIAASSRACGTGFNLQGFARNLCTDIPKSPISWEQRIGRTHRQGQRAERVEVDLLFGVIEDVRAFESAQEFALNVQRLTGQTQKLVFADTTEVLTAAEAEEKEGSRWKSSSSQTGRSSR